MGTLRPHDVAITGIGLVTKPTEWLWSSAREWLDNENGPITIDRHSVPLLFLVPKLRLGTPLVEAPLRLPAKHGRGEAVSVRGDQAELRELPFPRMTLGTRR